MTRPFAHVFVLFFLFSLVGCASMGRVQIELENQMKLGQYDTAVLTVESEREGAYRGKDRLLYFLERGMLQHTLGQYVESNAAFEEAKRIGQELYTESVTGQGLSLMTNDYALAYAGENFERTLIHLFSAMNYQMLGESDSALVEVRQVGEYLKKLQIDTENENVYQEDAFARYLSALLYEGQGEFDSSLVDYKIAIDAYADYGSNFSVPRPASLMPNAERVAGRLGSWATDDLRARGSDGQVREIPAGSGELIILHYNGLVPVKDQTKITIPFSEAWFLVAALQAATDDEANEQIGRATTFVSAIQGVDVISVAFPKYVDRSYSIALMEPRVAGATQIMGPELVEDIGAIAEKDLADRMARIYAKTVARAAIKYAIQKGVEMAAEQAGGDYGALLSAGTQIVGSIARYASEQADKRVWSTLPDKIYMTSMILPAGTHDVDVDFVNAQSAVVESQSIPQVDIAEGGRRFVILRTVN